MPQCLMSRGITAANGYGPASVFVNTASGDFNTGLPAVVLVPDASKSDYTQCSAVSISGAEYLALTKSSTGTSPTGSIGASGSLLDLTPEQAMPIAAAVFGVWAAAWAAKIAIRTLRGSDEKVD